MKKIALFLAFICFAGQVNAAQVRLDLEDAVEKILSESHDIKKAEFNIRKMQAVLDSTHARRLPKIDASGMYMNNINVKNPGEPVIISIPQMGGAPIEMPDNIGLVSVEASMPIYTFGKLGFGIDAARSAVKIAKSSAELARREMRVAAVQIYFGAKMSDHIYSVMEKSLENTRKNQRALNAGGGRANKANLLKISTDLAVKEAQLGDAKFNRDAAYRMFRIMSGLDEDDKIILTTDIPSEFRKQRPQEMDNYPEWDIYQEQYNASRSSMKSKYAQWMPTIAATAQYNKFMLHTEPKVWEGQKHDAASVGLALSLPIFDGGLARHQATQDARDADRAMQDLDKAKKMRRGDLTEAYQKHSHLIDNMKTQTRALDLAQRTYKMSADRFAVGQTSAVELSDVENSLVQLEIALMNTKMQIAITEETIKKLSGEK
ncbi:MAG: TolC family protein [Rickettsiales bacterium]|jgi:outer membrane protein TolC|nr:TolC family protein [Rickettsiales bacterium]